ncbi:MAG TPA: dephospho-CoA kinase [Methylophaga sp.]|nr:dephospho-CoA kinase [Methylophaga sp.]
MPLRVGLTGGIASGKSTVCDIFYALGAKIIDADIIAKDVCQQGMPAYQQIIAHFGDNVLLETGDLDRRALREIIFQDAAARKALEAIVHPQVRQVLQAQLKQSKATVTIVAVPLLVEAKMQDMFDRILLITANKDMQLARLLARETISEALAGQMVSAQIDDQRRLHYADDVIDNNGDVQDLTGQIEKLMKTYQQLAANNP